ncbi:MAG: cysteine desulfurase family protein [Planctomycetota bacterium]
MQPLHFDCNATTAASDEVVEAMLPWLGRPGANPSATHPAGQEAARAVRRARESVAALVGTSKPSTIVFTSCGSESIAMAFRSAAAQRHGGGAPALAHSTVEHSATRKAAAREAGADGEVVLVPVDAEGQLDRDALGAAIARRPALVSLILVNNETGAIADLDGVGHACREAGTLLHVDAVQGPGKAPIDVEAIGCDYLSLSAHKFHGPRGIGVLYVRDGAPVTPLMVGGPQEEERRAGTENVPAIVGLGVAAERARDLGTSGSAQAELAARRDRLEAAILAGCPGARVHGGTRRAANVTNIGFDLTGTGLDATALLGLLHGQGIEVSAGSACNSTRMAPSPVLVAMGLDEAAASSALRLSLAHAGTPDAATDEDVDRCAQAVVEAYGTLASLVP